jgi:hypothetical protein
MKVVYLIQTYRNPEQIYRLVRIIKQSSPNSHILISHDLGGCDLSPAPLRNLSGVELIKTKSKVRRGRFSLAQVYLDAISWLFNHNVEFDWLCYLSGQDYPTQPLLKIEKFLAETSYDGFLEYFDALSQQGNPWGIREGSDRYLYQYQWFTESLFPWQRFLFKVPRAVINNLQPLIRVNTSYGLSVGIRATSSPFNEHFRCYAGSEFKTLSKKCVQYLHQYLEENTDLINFYKKACIADESLVQSILVNSGKFNICNNNKRYIDWTGNRGGHPKILTIEDYPSLIEDDIHFARKFDIHLDSQILDMLDKRILHN